MRHSFRNVESKMNVKLAYVLIIDGDYDTTGVVNFNTKKAAQMYDRLLHEAMAECDGVVLSRIIYDEAE